MACETRTTCPYCGVGCGVLARVDDAGLVEIKGDPDHPSNFGALCSKGSALGETLGLSHRLLYPEIDGARVSWDVALDHVAQGFQRIIAEHGPGAVAFYLSGQLLTEDYYVANKLMKGFIGSANVDTNSRLCMSSSVAGHRRAFGSDTVPGCYEDIDQADLIVLVGSNAAWCHPILYRRMVKAQERGARIVVVDPQRTATADGADLHLPIAPGKDGVLFSGLLAHLATGPAFDARFVAGCTNGFEDALAVAREIAPDCEATACASGLAAEDVRAFFAMFERTERTVTLYSQGVNQSAQGTDKVGAIINCHLATGRIGRPGAGPFSLTGQPNAMGGREVGGLANQLAAHMHFEPELVERVARFWKAPNIATRQGLKAVDLFRAIGDGRIKALWVIGTNPVVSMPDADAVRAALAKLDLFVVSENVASTDTLAAGAHVRLPAAAWGEKSGTVTNSERRISRQRSFIAPPGEARPDWRIICDVAIRMGFGRAFDYAGPHEIFREHAALSAFENNGRRDFDLSGLASLGAEEYDALAPIQWPVEGPGASRKRMFTSGRFFTPNGRANFAMIAPPQLADALSQSFPLRLGTGRMRDQWHTMTRTGLAPRLGSHADAPALLIHPDDAAGAGLRDGGFAEARSERGAVRLAVKVSDAVRRGELFAPIHWNDQTAASARVGALVRGAADPISGQPELKATPVSVHPISCEFGGFVLLRERIPLPRDGVWAWQAVDGGFAARFACNEPAALFDAIAKVAPGAEHLSYEDSAQGVRRAAWIEAGRLVAVVYCAPIAQAPRWEAVEQAWRAEHVDCGARRYLLAGVAMADADNSPRICSCFGVSQAKILAEIEKGASDVVAIGARLRAGTNCGSCLPEIRKLVAKANSPALVAAE